MGLEGFDGGSQEVHRNIPRWCAKKMSLLSRAEMEAITRQEDDGDDAQIRDARGETTGQVSLSPHDRFIARAAELPMFLHTEALVLRRHEQQFRQYMKELVELSECVVLMCDGALRQQPPSTVSHAAEDTLGARQADDNALLRILCRAEELEGCARAAAVDRVRSAQRMVLAAAVAKRCYSTDQKSARRRVKVRR